MTETPVLVIGEALTDVLCAADGTRRSELGGSPRNVALGLARLGHPVRLATRVGRDADGDRMRDRLKADGVCLTDGSVVPGRSSTATARLDPDGSATYTFDIVWDLGADTPGLVRDGGHGHLHTGSIATSLAPGGAKVEEVMGAARGSATVSYDPNLRPALLGDVAVERERVARLVALSDVVKVSEEDLAWLYPGQDPDGIVRGWTRCGPALVVLTRGARPASCLWRAGRVDVGVPAVTVADTVGAGDAFMAGLVSGLLSAGLLGPAGPAGGPRERLRAVAEAPSVEPAVLAALERAALVAAITCSRPGADPPTAAELVR